jgi:hypothetical protein
VIRELIGITKAVTVGVVCLTMRVDIQDSMNFTYYAYEAQIILFIQSPLVI